MTVFVRLRLVRAILTAAVGVRALLWGAVVALSVFVGAVVADSSTGLEVGTRRLLLTLAILGALATVAALAWRDRHVGSLRRVALWLEECEPALQYRLVSAVETGREDLLAARAPHQPKRWTTEAWRRTVRAAAIPFFALAIMGASVLSLPRGAVARIRSPRPGDALDRAADRPASASRLSPLVARIRPPSYTGDAQRSIDEPSDVRALVGSMATIWGRGDAVGIIAVVGSDTLHATAEGERWSIAIRVGEHPAAVRLIDRGFQRLIAVEPVADSAPVVTMHTPARDSVLREPKGAIDLRANVSDAYGVATASFEYIVSSGEGETFTFKSGTLGARRPNAKYAAIEATLSLDALGLKPGDIVHLRAVARDDNNVSGPGIGASDTRAIRIARAGEYDSLAVEAAAPADADKSVLSERMLIQLAEALDRRRTSLVRDTVIRESRAIAADQKRLRRAVGEIIFTRLGGDPTGEEHTDDDRPSRAKTMEALLARADSATNRSTDPIDFEGGESPVVATNKPLLEAYNAMWGASTQLELGQPGVALPYMRRALAAIQRARQAERVYLRGRPPQVVLDLDKVRLKGKEKGSSSLRRPLTAADSMKTRLESRLLRAIDLTVRDARVALDSLLVLRIDALPTETSFAAALGDAARLIRAGRGDEASAALARARRALVGLPIARDSLSRWGLIP